jgi:hypothetical protein
MNDQPDLQADVWSEWLLHRRHADDPAYERVIRSVVVSIAEPILQDDAFFARAPHPWAPPLSIILAEQFTADERQFFEQVVRPTVEAGKNLTTERIVYLNAMKPVG